MICQARHGDMAAGRSPLPERPDARRLAGRAPADRLEAALDACLIDAAEATRRASPPPAEASPVPLRQIEPQAVVFSCRLSWMRGWLGRRWTKRAVAELFRGQVARRYLDGGWGECSVECGAPSAGMVFRFGIRTEADASLYARGTAALADLGEILGVERRAGRGRESTVGYLEDLRLGARLMRFDLEATRREADEAAPDAEAPGDADDGADDDDGYYPPFEGPPRGFG